MPMTVNSDNGKHLATTPQGLSYSHGKLMADDNETPPKTAPLAPWGTHERAGQNPFPIYPSEQAAHAAYWRHKESFAVARRRADERAKDNYIDRDRD